MTPPAAASPLASLPVRFVGSFPDPTVPLDPPLPELAFVGRSNVGKSSLLNALLGRPGLARVSATPGKTQHANVYALPGFYLVDLPGYGWARASQGDRAAYRQLITGFLTRRPTLAGVVWLLDVRHDPSKDDRAFQALLAETGCPVLPVFTKGDKFGKQAGAMRARALAREIGMHESEVLLTSSTDLRGISDLAESVLAVVGVSGGAPPAA